MNIESIAILTLICLFFSINLFTYTLHSILYTASPPVPPINMNAMEIKSRVSNSVEITIIFDTAFSRDNNVESYCIRSQGGACPNDSCVSPNNNYSCDGLEAGGEYIFTIRAINCGNQNGEETEVFSVTPRGELKNIHN